VKCVRQVPQTAPFRHPSLLAQALGQPLLNKVQSMRWETHMVALLVALHPQERRAATGSAITNLQLRSTLLEVRRPIRHNAFSAAVSKVVRLLLP
jgi:hypothetical protein